MPFSQVTKHYKKSVFFSKAWSEMWTLSVNFEREQTYHGNWLHVRAYVWLGAQSDENVHSDTKNGLMADMQQVYSIWSRSKHELPLSFQILQWQLWAAL